MSSYISKNPSIPRSGSTPKIVTYTLPTGERKFDYQTPQRKNIELTGSSVRKIHLPEAKEEMLFRRMPLKDQPDSKRTVVPDLAPEPREKNLVRSKSVRSMQTSASINPGNTNGLIYQPEREVQLRKKSTNPRVYESFKLTDIQVPEPYRRDVEYKKYDTTTQIYLLPGGVKRRQAEINDDTRMPLKDFTSNHSFNTKLIRDYNSNISCLPGSRINPSYEQQKKVSLRKYESNDIFNVNYSNTPCNLFNTSNKKPDNSARIFNESGQEKKLIQYPKAHRPGNIRDPFASQIKIC